MATYDYLKSKNGHKIQVESAKRDGAGKNIENNYAKQNGYYKQLTSGLADNLTPYSEDSGVHQENPFISNGTGTNNNQEIVTVGDYALIEQKQGNSVVVNQQLMDNLNFASTGGTVSTTSGIGTFTASASGQQVYRTADFLANHKYLTIVTFKTTTASSDVKGRMFANDVNGIATTNWQTVYAVGSFNSNTSSSIGVVDRRTSGWDAIQVKNAQVIDLTQWFGSNDNIPADLLANPSHWSWYQNFGDYIPYNTGSLESANGVKLVSTGRNIWDEIIELGGIDTTTGNNKSQSNVIRSKNYIKVIPNFTYYFYGPETTTTNMRIFYYDENKNFIGVSEWYLWNRTRQMPSNCRFIRFIRATSATVYENNITISLYYTPEQGGEGYDQYYPYEEPTIVDTGSEVLLSAGNVRDYKTKDGVIHRKVGVVDLGTLSYEYVSSATNPYFYAFISGMAKNGAQLMCNKYSFGGNSQYDGTMGDNTTDKVVYSKGNSDVIYLRDTSYTDAATFKTAMSGVYLYYELAQETTEQGTPYPETLPISDYGMLYWLDSSNNLVGIPQGAKIFFPVNYKGFVDDVYSRTSGDAGKLVLQEELAGYVKQVDLSSEITDVAGLTYQVKKAYKTGNIVSLSIIATNSTGSNIAADTELFDVGIDLRYGSTAMLVLGLVDATQCYFRINYSSGKCNCSQSISNGSTIVLFTTYAVA